MDHTQVMPKPVFPEFTGICPNVWVFYDRESDDLVISFSAKITPAYNVVVDDYTSVRVDFDTHMVVGIEIERFRTFAVKQNPELKPLLACTAGRFRSLLQPPNARRRPGDRRMR